MLYRSVNELEHFAFHDATILRMELTGRDMVWFAKDVNVSTDNSQNPHPTDMCLGEATVAWEGFAIRSLEIGGYDAYDYDGTLVQHVDKQVIPPAEHLSYLTATVNEYCWIFGLRLIEVPEGDDHAYVAAVTLSGHFDVFDMVLAFDKAVVSWDTFNGKAWYVDWPPITPPDAESV